MIEIAHDPITYEEGKLFGAVVNECNKAAEIDKQFGLTPYTDLDCLDSSVTESVIIGTTVYVKTMSQVFNDEVYTEKKSLTTVFQQQSITSIVKEL